MVQLDGSPKRAIVTGAGGGIGSAIVRRLAGDGAAVYGLDIDQSGLDRLAAGADDRIRTRPVDLADADSIASTIESCVADLGGLDIVVNAAGVIDRRGLDDLDVASWDRVLAINLRAPLAVVVAARPHLGPGAVIVNITSVQARVASADLVAYASSKGGLQQLTTALAVAFGSRGVRVLAVAPGSTATAMTSRLRDAPGFAERMRDELPIGRIIEPDEIAAAVAFAASEQASAMTGSTIMVDGGLLAQR